MARLWAKATVLGLAILFAGFGEAQPPQQDRQPAVLPALGPLAIDPRSASRDVSAGDSSSSVLVQRSVRSVPVDRNRDIYYKNKLEFALDVGWLPYNIPFPFDIMTGDNYNTYPLKYTLVPVAASLRWQMGNLKGPWVLRGNWDLTCSGSVTAIPRGPETRYFAYMMAIRRNFVPRNRKAAPYFDWRAGLGNIDAKGPLGVKYAQGQNFTFTLSMASGVRYNFNSRYGISAGLSWMHISNADLSQRPRPIWGIRNYGINVVGPMFGIDARLGGPKKHSEVK
jgi:hypothetical protein